MTKSSWTTTSGSKQRRAEIRSNFIDALAEYLTKDLAIKSVLLEMGDKGAKEWSKLWQAANLFGYPSKEEVVKHLEKLL